VPDSLVTDALDAALAAPEQTVEVDGDGHRRITYKSSAELLTQRAAVRAISGTVRTRSKQIRLSGSKGF